MKTPILKLTTKPIMRRNAELAKQYRHQMAAYDELDRDDKKTTEPPKKMRAVVGGRNARGQQGNLRVIAPTVSCWCATSEAASSATSKNIPGTKAAVPIERSGCHLSMVASFSPIGLCAVKTTSPISVSTCLEASNQTAFALWSRKATTMGWFKGFAPSCCTTPN